MTAIDYVVLFVIAASALGGFAKGFARSVITTVATIGGFFVAAYGFRWVARFIRPLVESDTVADLLGFLAVYLATILVGFFIARHFQETLKKVRLAWLDHVTGGAFGFFRGWFFCSVAYMALVAFAFKLDMVESSATKPYLAKGATLVSEYASKYLKAPFFEKLVDAPGHK